MYLRIYQVLYGSHISRCRRMRTSTNVPSGLSKTLRLRPTRRFGRHCETPSAPGPIQQPPRQTTSHNQNRGPCRACSDSCSPDDYNALCAMSHTCLGIYVQAGRHSLPCRSTLCHRVAGVPAPSSSEDNWEMSGRYMVQEVADTYSIVSTRQHGIGSENVSLPVPACGSCSSCGRIQHFDRPFKRDSSINIFSSPRSSKAPLRDQPPLLPTLQYHGTWRVRYAAL